MGFEYMVQLDHINIVTLKVILKARALEYLEFLYFTVLVYML